MLNLILKNSARIKTLTDRGLKMESWQYDFPVLYRITFLNDYEEFVYAHSSVEARNLIKNETLKDKESERSLQTTIVNVEIVCKPNIKK